MLSHSLTFIIMLVWQSWQYSTHVVKVSLAKLVEHFVTFYLLSILQHQMKLLLLTLTFINYCYFLCAFGLLSFFFFFTLHSLTSVLHSVNYFILNESPCHPFSWIYSSITYLCCYFNSFFSFRHGCDTVIASRNLDKLKEVIPLTYSP